MKKVVKFFSKYAISIVACTMIALFSFGIFFATGQGGGTLTSIGQNLSIAGGLQLNVGGGTKPTCNESNRGMMWREEAAGGYDEVTFCLQDPDGFTWYNKMADDCPISFSSFQDAIQDITYSVQPTSDDLWGDECLGEGTNFHFPDIGNLEQNNMVTFEMKEPVSVSRFAVKTRTHPGGSYFGNGKLYGSNNGVHWTQLAHLSGDGVCIYFTTNICTVDWKFYRFTMYGNARGTYQSISHIELDIRYIK